MIGEQGGLQECKQDVDGRVHGVTCTVCHCWELLEAHTPFTCLRDYTHIRILES
jgi:hypothetical protein